MSGENRELSRFAIWIHNKLSSRRPTFVLPQLSTERWSRFERLHRRLAIAHARNWTSSLAMVRDEIQDAVRGLRHHLSEFVHLDDADLQPLAVLSPREITCELQALGREFEAVEFDWRYKLIRVRIEPIELRGLYLGPFEIELNLAHMLTGDSRDYRVIACDPQPSRPNPDVTHPHVHNDYLCEGEGHVPIRVALETGRLYDFFILVATVLRTYNSGSPHVSIEKWNGIGCHGCGDSFSGEEICGCSRCGTESCSDCSTYCSICECDFCQDCTVRCPGCDEWFCAGCLEPCEACLADFCSTCLNKQQKCGDCHAQELEEFERSEESCDDPCASASAAT